MPAQVLHLDALYPGWQGLAAGSRAVAAVLERGFYQPFDWEAGESSTRTIALVTGRPLIVEGCGALTEGNLLAAKTWAGEQARVRAIWLEADATVRRERALRRDGDMFAPHWDEWANQEDEHFREHQPWLLADQIVRS